LQIKAGARGITCQKLGEAEVMANAGITDIIIATNLLGAARSGRLAKLQRRLPLKVCADNTVSLSAYSQAAAQAGRPMDVLIECETGQKRAGVETPKEALTLAKVIRDDPHLILPGFYFTPLLIAGHKLRCSLITPRLASAILNCLPRLFQPAAPRTLAILAV
jgi:D-serine deaminase-like pyridoxal phosphate-dependent protein